MFIYAYTYACIDTYILITVLLLITCIPLLFQLPSYKISSSISLTPS